MVAMSSTEKSSSSTAGNSGSDAEAAGRQVFSAAQCRAMLALARASLLGAFKQPEKTPEAPDWLQAAGACFVTLSEKNGALRGCIGSLEPYRSLGVDLIANARLAAFSDPRFAPVSEQELAGLRIAISVLTPAESISSDSEQVLLAQLRPGIDGLIVELDGRKATFLPSVWQQLPEPAQFVAALKRKAGLSAHLWSPRMRWQRYTTVGAEGDLY